MRIRIKSTNFDQSAATKALVDEKLAMPLEKLLAAKDTEEDIVMDVELAKTTKHHNEGKIWKCEVNLDLSHIKRVLRASSMGESLEEAVNLVKYELEREIKKYKDKPITKIKKEARNAKYQL